MNLDDIVYGDAVVEAAGGVGSVHISGSEASTWVDRIISSSFLSISMKAGGGESPQTASMFELTEGIAPAEAILLTSTAPEAMPDQGAAAVISEPDSPEETPQEQHAGAAPSPMIDDEPLLSVAPLSVVSLREANGAERREPLPVSELASATPGSGPVPIKSATVKGVHCKHGHFNHPQALYCVYDGSALVDVTRIEVDGPRPSLGVLVFDDGKTYALESDYVVGRSPQGHESVIAGEALALVVDDPQEHVSRSHLLLHLSGWDVQVRDLGSRNGSFVTPPGASESLSLAPDQLLTIEPGTRVRVGEKSFAYESHHRL